MKKSLKTIVAISALSLTLGVALAVGGKAEVKAAKAGTATTVYYAISSETVGNYTVKFNAKLSNEKWETGVMTRDGNNTQGGYLLYTYSYTDEYNGVDVMQFQLYDGNTWISQQEPISSWKSVDTYQGKVYVYDTGWADYNPDTVFYTVARYQIFDGGEPVLVDSESKAAGTTYDVPATIDEDGYIFDKWYTDAECTNPYTAGPVNADLNLYAKYTTEPTTGYYIVGDAAFMTEFGTSGTPYEFDSGLLMDVASGVNKAVYTFTTTTTITIKARYYSHAQNWWVSTTGMDKSAEDHGVTYNLSGDYVVPAGTYTLYILVENNNDKSSLTWGMPLDAYVDEFLDETGKVCKGDNTVRAQLLSAMSKMESNWSKISSDDQTTLTNANANEESSNLVEQVAARYDFILGKYGYGEGENNFHDFMGRTPSPATGQRITLLENKDSNSTAIILLAICGSAIAVGGYFLLKKARKED